MSNTKKDNYQMKSKLELEKFNNAKIISKFQFLFGFNPIEQKASHKHTVINKESDQNMKQTTTNLNTPCVNKKANTSQLNTTLQKLPNTLMNKTKTSKRRMQILLMSFGKQEYKIRCI